MKVLVATEKPFAAAAVNGIKAEIEAAGNELVLLEKYTEKAQLLDAVKDADAMIIRSDKVDAERPQCRRREHPRSERQCRSRTRIWSARDGCTWFLQW